jgi:hypothetical protein
VEAFAINAAAPNLATSSLQQHPHHNQVLHQ